MKGQGGGRVLSFCQHSVRGFLLEHLINHPHHHYHEHGKSLGAVFYGVGMEVGGTSSTVNEQSLKCAFEHLYINQ